MNLDQLLAYSFTVNQVSNGLKTGQIQSERVSDRGFSWDHYSPKNGKTWDILKKELAK